MEPSLLQPAPPDYSTWTSLELDRRATQLKADLDLLVEAAFEQMEITGDFQTTWVEIATWDGLIRSPPAQGTVLYARTKGNPKQMKTPLDATSIPIWHLWITREKHPEIAAIGDEIQAIKAVLEQRQR